MASGLGPNFIFPLTQWFTKNLTGTAINADNAKNPIDQGWFGTNPMQGVGDAMNRGRAGFWQAPGPQSTNYQPDYFHGGTGAPVSAGTNLALFGSSYDPKLGGESAYQRFAGSGDRWAGRFATDIRDKNGNLMLASPMTNAGFRMNQEFGGRDAQGNPLSGANYLTPQFNALQQLQQGANPYLNNPLMAAYQAQAQEQTSPFARANPAQYQALASQANALGTGGNAPWEDAQKVGFLKMGDVDPIYNRAMGGVAETYNAGQLDLNEMALQQAKLAQQGIDYTGGMTNQYEKDLMDQMAHEGSKDLSLGLQDAQTTMAAMGLGRSGQGESTGAGVWRDIQERNAADRQQLQAQFAEQAMNRRAATSDQLRGIQMGQVGNAIMGQQQGTINAALAGQGAGISAGLAGQQAGLNALLAAQQFAGQGREAGANRMFQAGMAGQDALTGSLEASRAAQRQALLGGQSNTLNWNLGQQGNYLQSLLGGDQAALNRMIAQGNYQSQGLNDYTNLWNINNQMRQQDLGEMMTLEDRQMQQQQAIYDQQRFFNMMPYDAMMTMMTGISPTQMQSRQSPWPGILGSIGGSYLGNLAGGGGQRGYPTPLNLPESNNWQNA